MLGHIQTRQWERNVYLLLRTVHQSARIVYVDMKSKSQNRIIDIQT